MSSALNLKISILLSNDSYYYHCNVEKFVFEFKKLILRFSFLPYQHFHCITKLLLGLLGELPN